MVHSRLAFIDSAMSQKGEQTVQFAGLTARWEGLVYVDDFRAQQESVQHWLEQVDRHGLDHSMLLLKGAFFMLLQNVDGTVHAFVDNSGMFPAYWSPRGVSQSYLSLVDALGLGVKDVDTLALMEFLQTSNIYYNKTHFPDVRKIAYDERLEYRANTAVQKHCKPVAFIDSPIEHQSLLDSFKGYAHALAGTKISVDVTGGLDTRTLIAAMHAMDMDFETSVSGHPQHPDVVLGAKVAHSIDRPFYATTHNACNLQSELEATVESLDGLRSHVLTQHRLKQYQSERYDRGMTLTLKGLGGELYRDFIWLQDFPRYGSSRVDFERMHRMRMEMLRIPETLLSDEYRAYGEQVRAQRIEQLQRYQRDTNTQSYDVAHCREFLQVAASRQLGSWAYDGNLAQAPLSEIFRLQHPYHQAPSQRFGAHYQKRFITDCSLKLAKVYTTYGTRATTLASDIPRDMVGRFTHYSKTFTRKLSQRYLNKTPFPLIPADDSDASRLFATSLFTRNMLNVLVQHGIFNPSVRVSDVPARFLPNCVAAGHFLSRL